MSLLSRLASVGSVLSFVSSAASAQWNFVDPRPQSIEVAEVGSLFRCSGRCYGGRVCCGYSCGELARSRG